MTYKNKNIQQKATQVKAQEQRTFEDTNKGYYMVGSKQFEALADYNASLAKLQRLGIEVY